MPTLRLRALFSRVACGATGLLTLGIVACSSPGDTTPTPGKNFVKVTLNGQTKTYTDVKLDAEGTAGTLVLWTISATAGDEHLAISMWGSGGGRYAYKPRIDSFKQVSQIDYKTNTGTLANYMTMVCPNQTGFYASPGVVDVTQYTDGKVAKGTFSGALLSNLDADNCDTKGTSFSGEFSISQ